MKKFICILLSLMLLMSLAACGETEQETLPPEETTAETDPETTEATTEPEPKEAAASFYMDLKNPGEENPSYLSAYDDGNGGAYVEYCTASGRKIATMERTVLEQLAAAYRLSVLPGLNGKDVYDEGEACCSFSIDLGAEMCTYNFYGTEIPEEVATAFADMEALFVQVMEGQPEYVPMPQINGQPDESHKAEILAILNGSGIAALDSLAIMDLQKDEYFAENAGLTNIEGIQTGTSCSALMMTVPYSMVLVTVEEGTDVDAVAEDFANSINWNRWVCVRPNRATIAVKDHMVLCLLGQDEMYTGTVTAIEANGWTVVKTLQNSGL